MEIEGVEVIVASPCDVSWESMHGDDKSRFCHQCNLYVYDLQVMDEDERIDFMRMAREKGRGCARIYQRTDGRALQKDCPLGLRLKKTYQTMKIGCGLIAAAVVTGGIVAGINVGAEYVRAQLSDVDRQLKSLTMGSVYIPPPKQ